MPKHVRELHERLARVKEAEERKKREEEEDKLRKEEAERRKVNLKHAKPKQRQQVVVMAEDKKIAAEDLSW